MDRREIFGRITADVEKGALVFPASADVALQVQRALDDPDCSIDQAARLVKTEPLLAARVVAMANSAAYNSSGRESTDIKQAVSRLGFRTLRSLANAVIVRQMAGGPSDPAHRAMARQLWEHSAHVAALAHVLARRVTHLDAETALFAGILHEIGGFYLLSRAQEFPGLFEGDRNDLAAAWCGESEAMVGRAVLKILGVPHSTQQVLEYYWDGYLALPPVSMGDTLLLADELAPIASPLLREKDYAERRANIDVVLGDESLKGILTESADAVGSLTAALKF